MLPSFSKIIVIFVKIKMLKLFEDYFDLECNANNRIML